MNRVTQENDRTWVANATDGVMSDLGLSGWKRLWRWVWVPWNDTGCCVSEDSKRNRTHRERESVCVSVCVFTEREGGGERESY